MRTRGFASCAVLALALGLVAGGRGPAESASFGPPGRQAAPSRPLVGIEPYERMLEASDLVLLARVLSADSVRTSRALLADGTLPPGAPTRLRRVRLEPLQWLLGGLDGELIETEVIEGGPEASGEPASDDAWRAVAGVDTMGVLVALRRFPPMTGLDPDHASWALLPIPESGLPGGMRALSQRQWRGVRDSVQHARAADTLDSLTARADRIVVAAASAARRAVDTDPLVHLKVERALKGAAEPADVTVRAWRNLTIFPGDVLFLRVAGDGVAEILPFHHARTPDPGPWIGTDTTVTEAESAVRAALARLAAAKARR